MKRNRPRPPYSYWWWFTALAATCAFTLGLWGFQSVLAPTDKPRPSFWDSLYRTMQLFFLSWETPPPPIPWQLELARFLAAFVALSTVVVALCELLRDRVALLRLWFFRNHVVVCGLGPGGIDLVADLRGRGQRVVVIEAQEQHPDLGTSRRLGAIVLIGSPTDPWLLGQAGVDRAATLLSLCQEDAACIESLMNAYRLNANRLKGSLRCILLVFDPELRSLLLKEKKFQDPHGPILLELFNLYDIGAQVMLRESPAMFSPNEPRRLLIVGMGWLGQMLLERVVRAWHIERLDGRNIQGLNVIVIDRLIEGLETRLNSICPRNVGDYDLIIRQMDVQGDDFLAGKYLDQQDSGNRPDAAFVCLADDRLALLTVLRLRERFGPGLPIVVRMSSCKGVAGLLLSQSGQGVHSIGLLDLASTMQLVINAPIEMLAREIHRDYVLDRFSQGETRDSNQLLVPWHELADEFKESNRQAGAHLDAILQAIGCKKVPKRTLESLFRFSPDEVEALAKLEHKRWCEERKRNGWRFDPIKDVEKKLSPYLVAFEKLPETMQQSNRNVIQRIPVWLAKAGFAIECERGPS